MKKQFTDIAAFITMNALLVATVVGYFANIVKLIGSNEAIGFLILRGIGIICPPIGAVLGWF